MSYTLCETFILVFKVCHIRTYQIIPDKRVLSGEFYKGSRVNQSKMLITILSKNRGKEN